MPHNVITLNTVYCQRRDAGHPGQFDLAHKTLFAERLQGGCFGQNFPSVSHLWIIRPAGPEYPIQGSFFIRFSFGFRPDFILGIEAVIGGGIRFFAVDLAPQNPGIMKSDYPARSQFHRFIGPGIAPPPGFFAPDLELAESADQDILFTGQGIFDYGQELLHGHAGVFPRQNALPENSVDYPFLGDGHVASSRGLGFLGGQVLAVKRDSILHIWGLKSTLGHILHHREAENPELRRYLWKFSRGSGRLKNVFQTAGTLEAGQNLIQFIPTFFHLLEIPKKYRLLAEVS
jgi:hypothetical protein